MGLLQLRVPELKSEPVFVYDRRVASFSGGGGGRFLPSARSKTSSFRRTQRSTCGGAPPALHYYYYYYYYCCCCECFQAPSGRFNPNYCTSQCAEPILLHAVSVRVPHPCLARLCSGFSGAEQLPWSRTVTQRSAGTFDRDAFKDFITALIAELHLFPLSHTTTKPPK